MKPIKRSIIIICIVVVLVAIGTVVFLMSSGRLAVVMKQPSQKTLIVKNVCGEEMIDRYNTAFDIKHPEKYPDTLKSIAKDIEANPDYAGDANCQYILYNYDILALQDTQKATQTLTKLKQLSEQGQNPSMSFRVLNSIPELESASNNNSEIVNG